MKRLLDYDPINKVSCFFEYGDDGITLTHEQDVSPILEANKRSANDDEKTKRGWKKDWWKYASVPAIVEIEWRNKFGVDLDNRAHRKKIFELLNHPDYRYLKATSKIHTVSDGD